MILGVVVVVFVLMYLRKSMPVVGNLVGQRAPRSSVDDLDVQTTERLLTRTLVGDESAVNPMLIT
jgi:Na+-transporting methylmalonyl-CoA/oxaloacetate decarboxylase gamma subunit